MTHLYPTFTDACLAALDDPGKVDVTIQFVVINDDECSGFRIVGDNSLTECDIGQITFRGWHQRVIADPV